MDGLSYRGHSLEEGLSFGSFAFQSFAFQSGHHMRIPVVTTEPSTTETGNATPSYLSTVVL